MIQRRRSRTSLAAGFGLALLLVISVFSYLSTERYVESSRWREHSEEVVRLTHSIQVSVERSETAQRGFLMTDQSGFLKIYKDSVDSVKDDLEKLLKTVSDNETQLLNAVELKKVVLTRFDELQKNINASLSGRKSSAIDSIKMHQGKNMKIVRDQFKSFLEAEHRLLRERAAVAESDFWFARLMALVGILVAFFLLLMVTLFLRTESKHRRRAEERALEASALKTQFLANMSHEIRTPINGVIGMTKILSGTKLDREQSDAVSTIRDSSNSLLALINQILDISKIESGQLQLEEVHFELRSLVESTKSIVAYSANMKGIEISLTIAPDVPDLFLGDPLRIRQILLNLLNNAIKFSFNGKIELRIKKLGDLKSSLRLGFEIIDEGIGIDRPTIERLFKSFAQGDVSTTRQFGGTGLGLSISKQLVEAMGGVIGVESEVGEGSRFFFEIEVRRGKYDLKAQVESSVTVDPSLTGHILVAEDNLTNHKVAAAMLSKMGFTFEFANDGGKAIELLENRSFDLILMDGQMPVLDGYEVTRRIRRGVVGESCRKIPIIAVTANAIKGDVERCLESGMDDYVAKPISYENLLAKISHWLATKNRSLDSDILNRLKVLASDDSKSLIKDVIDMFTSSSPKAFSDLRNSLKKKDFEEFNRSAHHYKSTCMNVGATRMRNIMHRLEKTTEVDDVDATEKLIAALESEYEVVIQELERYNAA